MKKIIVIGGGASGMMAAICAARCGAAVTILEHNEKIGKKVLATGNGRCNLTNRKQSAECYRSNSSSPWKIIEQFPFSKTLDFFSELGIETREKDGWFYPYNFQAASVVQALEMELAHLKVKVKTKEDVLEIKKTLQGYEVFTQSWHYPCDHVIVSCGSPASSVEGSSDTGYKLAEQLGHHLISPLPALVALKGKGGYFPKWAGSRNESKISLFIDGELIQTEVGELLLSDYGVSGIPIFQLSRYAALGCVKNQSVTCVIDFLPDFSIESLYQLIEKRKKNAPWMSLHQLFNGLLPKKVIGAIINPKSEWKDVLYQIKNWTIPIKEACTVSQAQVCQGGIDLAELTDTLESRFHPGIYFTGEVVDVDGPCGGYNLQWAWSSGAVAGMAAAGREMTTL